MPGRIEQDPPSRVWLEIGDHGPERHGPFRGFVDLVGGQVQVYERTARPPGRPIIRDALGDKQYAGSLHPDTVFGLPPDPAAKQFAIKRGQFRRYGAIQGHADERDPLW